jgi:hypothetical protein
MVVLSNLIGLARTSQFGHWSRGNFNCIYLGTIISEIQKKFKNQGRIAKTLISSDFFVLTLNLVLA